MKVQCCNYKAVEDAEDEEGSFPCACYYYYDECMILIYCSQTSNGEMALKPFAAWVDGKEEGALIIRLTICKLYPLFHGGAIKLCYTITPVQRNYKITIRLYSITALLNALHRRMAIHPRLQWGM